MASTMAAMSKEVPPSRTAPQFVVRMPDEEFRDRIAKAAKANNRSMNAEIVSRLQDSFGVVAAEHGGLQRLEAEVTQQRTLAESFRHLGDMGDALRSVVAAMAKRVIQQSPDDARAAMLTEGVSEQLAAWLEKQDPRGAAFSLVELLDGSSPQVVEDLRNFASHLEDLGLYRKRISLTIRGKRTETDMYANSPKPATEKESRAPAKKVLLVGSLGRDAEPQHSTFGGQKLATPATPRGPVKSPNARKPRPR